MAIGIYCFTFPNGKEYIGQTRKGFERRFQQHLSRSNNDNDQRYGNLIYKAIRKYGWDNIAKNILRECSIEELDEREVFYIKERNTLHPGGYNLTTGGQLGTSQAKDVCIRRANTLKKLRAETPFTDETKALMSKKRIEYIESHPESMKILADHNRGSKRADKDTGKYSKCHRKNKDDLPRFVWKCKRVLKNGDITYFYRIARHPLCKDRSFKTKECCLIYLDIIDLKYKLNELLKSQEEIINILNDNEIQLNKLVESTNDKLVESTNDKLE